MTHGAIVTMFVVRILISSTPTDTTVMAMKNQLVRILAVVVQIAFDADILQIKYQRCIPI